MKSPRISLKLYADQATVPPHAKLVEVWHRWIKEGVLSELLVDVVDYGHVHRGPAVLLVGHESDYALDYGDGRAGLLYVRKRAPDDASKRLEDALLRVANAAKLLEAEPLLGGLKLETSSVLLRVLDRLNAPNEPATWEADRAEIERVAARAFGEGARAAYVAGDQREPFTVRIESPGQRSAADVAAALGAA